MATTKAPSEQAEMCAERVQAGFEAYRPCEVVHLRRICPSFSLPALRFRPPQHIVLLLHEMDSKREWNGRFGTQVTKTLSFRVRPP